MDDLQALVNDIHGDIATHAERGKVADYIPELAAVDAKHFGIAVTTWTDRSTWPARPIPPSRSRASPRCSR